MIQLLEKMNKKDFKANPQMFHRIVQVIYDFDGVQRRQKVKLVETEKSMQEGIDKAIKYMHRETALKKFFNLI